MYNEVTVLFVSFHSDDIIEKSIITIDKNIKIIVVENSVNNDLKSKLEKKYPNVSVVLPEKNLGNGAGINFGLKKINTKFAFYLDVDTELFPDTITKLLLAAKKVKEFSILAPKINNFEYKKNCYLKLEENSSYHKMRFVTGCALFFKKKLFDDVGYFDEQIFLYYEENDFYERCLKKGKSIFLVEDSKINHIGNASVKKEFRDQIEINRNWHLMWSTFYFHKKHYGYFSALIKVLPKFISAFLNFLFFSLVNNKNKKDIYFARFSGILNSIIGKKSWFRPKLPKG